MGGLKNLVLAIALFPISATSAQGEVHPQISCWAGEPISGDNETDFGAWTTDQSTRPYLITHDRDHFRERGEVVQDYNYIIYWFGNPGAPIQARHYLLSREVSLILPLGREQGIDLEQARSAIPNDVLCYLQKRFEKIDVLTAEGYEEVWSLGEEDD